MKKKNIHHNCSIDIKEEQDHYFATLIARYCDSTVKTLHKYRLTFTTALILGLLCSWPVPAAELELKPTFDNPGVKVASVTFLPDFMDDDKSHEIDMDINIDTKWCEDKGFRYGCPDQQAPYETCSRDSNYVKCDKATWCKLPANGYTITSCSLPKYVNKQCPNGEKLYKECVVNNQQACKDIGYVNTCPSGQKLYYNTNRCSWDNSYGKCCSPSGCPANTSTSGSYGDSGSKDTCGYACKYTCNMSCPAGTTEYNPGGCGGSTRNGCNTKTCYYAYKACCDNSCANSSPCSSSYYQTTSRDGCGNTCYNCYSGKVYKKQWAGGVNGSGRNYTWYLYSQEYCLYKNGSRSNIGGQTQTYRGCWDCDYAHAQCGAACSYSCYHSNYKYNSVGNYITDHYNHDCFDEWTGGYC